MKNNEIVTSVTDDEMDTNELKNILKKFGYNPDDTEAEYQVSVVKVKNCFICSHKIDTDEFKVCPQCKKDLCNECCAHIIDNGINRDENPDDDLICPFCRFNITEFETKDKYEAVINKEKELEGRSITEDKNFLLKLEKRFQEIYPHQKNRLLILQNTDEDKLIRIYFNESCCTCFNDDQLCSYCEDYREFSIILTQEEHLEYMKIEEYYR